jgi:hypothetical protein
MLSSVKLPRHRSLNGSIWVIISGFLVGVIAGLLVITIPHMMHIDAWAYITQVSALIPKEALPMAGTILAALIAFLGVVATFLWQRGTERIKLRAA